MRTSPKTCLVSRATGAHPAVVHREVTRLVETGLVTDRRVGRTRVLRANLDYPLLAPLTELITRTYGPLPVLRDALTGRSGVEEAMIHGSWAQRLSGEPGPFPRDVDVLVVGTAAREILHNIADAASTRLHLDVNIARVSPAEWAAGSDPFVSTVRSRPVVAIIDGEEPHE